MSPSPSWRHQSISVELLKQLSVFLTGKPCKVFHAPFDVRLNGWGDDDSDVFQPDLVVICDRVKIDNKGCNGAPDMVIEILSLSSQRYDLNEKFNIYQAGGVKEYWVVSPKEKGINVFLLQNNGKYDAGTVYEGDVQVPVQTLKGLSISTEKLFN